MEICNFQLKLDWLQLYEGKKRESPQELNSFCWTLSDVTTPSKNNSRSIQHKLCPKVCDLDPESCELLKREKQTV